MPKVLRPETPVDEMPVVLLALQTRKSFHLIIYIHIFATEKGKGKNNVLEYIKVSLL